MTKYVTCLVLLVWLSAGIARADPFADCDSAYHYGANTARWFVSSTFARVERGAISAARAHVALDSMLRVYGSRAREGDAFALCQLQGLWEGFVDQLAIAHLELGDVDCLVRLVLAERARALLSGIVQSREVPGSFGEEAALLVFGGSRGSGQGAPWCEALSADACAAALVQEDVDAQLELEPLIGGIASLLCMEPD